MVKMTKKQKGILESGKGYNLKAIPKPSVKEEIIEVDAQEVPHSMVLMSTETNLQRMMNDVDFLIACKKFRSKKKDKFPPQDTSTDIVCGDPTEDYRY